MRKELKRVAIYAIEEDLPVEFENGCVVVGTPSDYIRVTYDETAGYHIHIRWDGWCDNTILSRMFDIVRQIKSQN